ncbi:MAG: cytochrome-c peroxidase [Chitinophagia bacterium]|jgi:cytochrome c peroxidase|nr:cytochrome-c peroxidase [Chitinophagia bacterium]
MRLQSYITVTLFAGIFCIIGCSKNDEITIIPSTTQVGTTTITTTNIDPYAAIKLAFGTNIDPSNLENYANQDKPVYILKNNLGNNVINDKTATLGRVLFYDKNLSINNTISCSSCHKQNFAFGDTAEVSAGVEGGLTIRHSMRLINTRFANEAKFFWNERAANLNMQTTMPIVDHLEMGFSGENGRGNINTLIGKLSTINYYKELFKFTFGDSIVTENRIQNALASFVSSIQSFDSKYDIGRALVNNDNQPFPNFTATENQGKTIFLTPPVFNGAGLRTTGGLGCNACHNAPEFDIDPNTLNNGIIGIANSANGIDITNTRAGTLRDITNSTGAINTPMMHTGALRSLRAVINHYNTINLNPRNTNLDPRLRPGGNAQNLNVTEAEIAAIIAFMQTLGGNNVYVNKKWSNPFLN